MKYSEEQKKVLVNYYLIIGEAFKTYKVFSGKVTMKALSRCHHVQQ